MHHQVFHHPESALTHRMEITIYNLLIHMHNCTARLRKPRINRITIHKRLLSKCSYQPPTDGGY
jgi:hypothetical protein